MKKSLNFLSIFFSTFLIFSDASKAELEAECHNDENEGWAYCINTTVGSESKDALYFFHGVTGSENSWTEGANIELREGIRKTWEENNLQAPTVVTISYGSTWMLNDDYYEKVANNIIPMIEERHLKSAEGKRLVMGVSMGGFNALQLLFKKKDFFSRAAILSPMIPICDPWLEKNALYICIAADTSDNNAYATYQSHQLVKSYFSNRSEWDQVNPLNLAQDELNESFPPTILSTGFKDAFGFFSTSHKLSKIAERNLAPVKWEGTYLEHAQYDYKKVGLFLMGIETEE